MEEMSQSHVARLVERSRRGDSLASNQLMATYRPYLRLLAGRRLPRFIHKRVDGSDIVQQTLVDAMRGLPEFRGQSEGEFTAWMLRLLERNVLQNTRLNMAEKRDVRREMLDHLSEGSARLNWHTVARDQAPPHGSVFRGEAALLLAQALERLPDDQRTAVEKRYLGHDELDTIAREMGKTTSAVAGLIRRGVERLGQYLPRELGDA